MRIALVLVFLFAGSALASPPEDIEKRVEGKRAWEWKDEDRMKRRFDPALSKARSAKAAYADLLKERRDPQPVNVAIGSEDPELFLPGELFDHLLPLYLKDEKSRQEKRARLLARVPHLRLKPDFWDRLYATMRAYVEAAADHTRIQRQAESSDPGDPALQWLATEHARLNDLICSSRPAVLAAARQEFGRETFDRFLYEAVAPDAVSISSIGRDPREDGDTSLWYWGGCQ